MISRAWLPPILILLACVWYFTGPIGRLLVGGCVVLFAPGYIMWTVVGRDLRLPRLAAPAIWLGLSLSLIPIVFLWSSTLGLRLLPPILRLQAGGLALIAVWSWLRTPHRLSPRWLIGGWSFVLLCVGITRWLQISYAPILPQFDLIEQPMQSLRALAQLPAQLGSFQSVPLPLWVDSVHHTLLVRVVSETGQIPRSLEPYLPVPQLIYHWGYHTVAATWRAVSDLPLATTVLWSGQVLNASIALSMYALGAYLLRSPLAGLIAAGSVGLLSLMPAYYVTWGRYTQLTGLVLLPALVIASVALAERATFSWRLVLLTGVLLAGLMVIHYRVLVFYAAWMLPYGVLLLAQRPRRLGALIVRFAAASVAATVLVAPWVVVMLRQIIIPVANAPAALVGNDTYNGLDWALLRAGNAVALYAIAALGALLAALRPRWRVVAVAGWIGTMLLIANPTVLGLPPSWFINNHSVAITLFMPVGILVGACCQEIIFWSQRALPRSIRRGAAYAAAVACVALGLIGTWQLRTVINPVTALATPADLPALAWAAEHTPSDARFLVNTMPWLNGSPRGTDAGWWLLPLAGRWVSTPPVLYIYGDPAYKQTVEALNQRISRLDPAAPDQLHQLIRDMNITHLYLGGTHEGPLKADVLLSDPMFEPVYDANGVTILAVRANS